jgi:hypothetical protein
MENSAGEIVYALQRFGEGIHGIRGRIEEMDNDQLIAVYQQAKRLGLYTWYIRCLIIGVAKQRAVKGDGALKQIAEIFGIKERMAQTDVQVYETFIKDDPDFDPALPAAYYQFAARATNPQELIQYAIEHRPPLAEFARIARGLSPAQESPKGLFRLVLVEEEVPASELTPLSGRVHLYSSNGENYARIQ